MGTNETLGPYQAAPCLNRAAARVRSLGIKGAHADGMAGTAAQDILAPDGIRMFV